MKLQLNNRDHLRRLREGIVENLSEFAQESGLSIKTGSIRFEGDGTGAKITLDVGVVQANGQVDDEYTRAFRRYAHCIGFLPEELHAEVKYHGKLYTIEGYRAKAHRFPLILQEKGGTKRICTTVDAAQRNLVKGAQ